jgi:hypothetical protein
MMAAWMAAVESVSLAGRRSVASFPRTQVLPGLATASPFAPNHSAQT